MSTKQQSQSISRSWLLNSLLGGLIVATLTQVLLFYAGYFNVTSPLAQVEFSPLVKIAVWIHDIANVVFIGSSLVLIFRFFKKLVRRT